MRKRAQPIQEVLESALASRGPTFGSSFIPEPELTFGGGGRSTDPKTGLTVYGPYGAQEGVPIRQVRLGVIGTGATIDAARNWFDRCRRRVHAVGKDIDPARTPPFPGFEDPQGFNCHLDVPNQLVQRLTPVEVVNCQNARSRDSALEYLVKVIREKLQVINDNESPPDVVVIAPSQELRDLLGGGRRQETARTSTRQKGSKQRDPLQAKLFVDVTPTEESISPSRTLHRALKAEGMRANLPIQLAWPGTFSGGDAVEDDATRAWNLCTALFYKARGVPWRVTGLARNTCYVGISFYRPVGEPGYLQTSMAQAFSDTCDGVVLKGASFQWNTAKQGTPHLTRDAAKELLASVLSTYQSHMHQQPIRVVIHKSSRYSDDELAGFRAALPDSVSYHDFVSVGDSSIQFLRPGKEPPVRGTAVQLAEREYLLYTRGYIPFLRVYPGARVPQPLYVSQHHGSGGVTEILAEIMALTKMNWNSAAYACAKPITLHFAEDVGLILSELPPDVQPKPFNKFYM